MPEVKGALSAEAADILTAYSTEQGVVQSVAEQVDVPCKVVMETRNPAAPPILGNSLFHHAAALDTPLVQTITVVLNARSSRIHVLQTGRANKDKGTERTNQVLASAGFQEVTVETLFAQLHPADAPGGQGASASAQGSAAGAPPAVLDVRTRAEYARGRVPGALNVPLDELSDAVRAGRLDAMRTRPLAVICQAGIRSAQVLPGPVGDPAKQTQHGPPRLLAHWPSSARLASALGAACSWGCPQTWTRPVGMRPEAMQALQDERLMTTAAVLTFAEFLPSGEAGTRVV